MAMYWHEATGHTNLTFLRSICTTVDGMEELQQLPSDYKLPPCSVCMLAKSRALPTPKKAERSKMVHHLVHSDTTERNVQAGRAPAVLRTDNAGEMTSETFEAQLAAEGSGPPRFPSLNIPLEEEVVETQDDDTQPEAYEPNRRPRSRANRASRNRRRGRQASA